MCIDEKEVIEKEIDVEGIVNIGFLLKWRSIRYIFIKGGTFLHVSATGYEW